MSAREVTYTEGDYPRDESTKKEARAAAPAFSALGASIAFGRPKTRIVPLPNGSIVLEINKQDLYAFDRLGDRRGLTSGSYSRAVLGEELGHAGHLAVFRDDWLRDNEGLLFDDYVRKKNKELFRDIRKTIEEAPPRQRAVLQNAVQSVYNLYFASLDGGGSKTVADPALALAKIEEAGEGTQFVEEFIRQAVQLHRQGAITENVLANILARLGAWVRPALEKVRAALPNVYKGAFGEKARSLARRINEELDILDGRPPRQLESIEAIEGLPGMETRRGVEGSSSQLPFQSDRENQSPFLLTEQVRDKPASSKEGDNSAVRFILELEKSRLHGRLAKMGPGTAAGKIFRERLSEIQALADRLGTRKDHQPSTGLPSATNSRGGFFPETKSPSTGLSPARNAEHSRRVQSWVGQVTAPWANWLPIVVHNSASAIPDTALRELVTFEENVDGFYNPADGSIHLIADKVTSHEDAERIIRHEGMHLVFDGPLREEYLDLLDRVAKSIPEDRLREISERYKNQGPEVWLEEYLAQEGQNSPKSPVWRQFVYEIKRLLRRAFGDSVEFSDADIVAFLSKARRTMESGSKESTRRKLSPKEESFSRIQQERGRILGKISATDPRSAAAEILKDRLGELDEQLSEIQPAASPPWGDLSDLRFAKTPKRSSWSEVRDGDSWNSVKRLFPTVPNIAPEFDTRGSKNDVVARAAAFLEENPVVQDSKGRMVYLPYPQTKGGYPNPVLNRAEHVTCTDEKAGAHNRNLQPGKAKWLAAVVETIKNAPVRVHDGSEILYFRSYVGYTHQVTTSKEGVFLDHKTYDAGLVTQYPVHLKKESYHPDAWVELLK